MKKKWYESKTIWVNVIFAIATFSNYFFGVDIPAEVQGAIIILINLALRIITKESIEW